MPSKKDLSLATIARYFHMPIVEAAGILGVCTTVLKKVCRRHGIKRWPQRKLQSLNKRIEVLEHVMPNAELSSLKQHRACLTHDNKPTDSSEHQLVNAVYMPQSPALGREAFGHMEG
eukprot:CAMPEP_0205876220 /NCGR_PEP_ID=MMETSP1083-20121108/13675_1 /ASSEMBLY_ACC=CAM_ASM_000430 /TAXON_ID=97485 /ORGANISM="Prymnesium parvum, Strain Texoma1" /LENGTH=116 /DNA_ID=CAMNT_0053238953 /DNA_START=63 /DNA_END=409 /DNA_ORIENTATION=+